MSTEEKSWLSSASESVNNAYNSAQDWVSGLTNWKTGADIAKQTENFLNGAISISNIFVSVAGTTGIAGFVFDIAEDESVELSSLITDHYVETGSAVQDHITMRPERVTVKGLIGEYKDIRTGKQSFLQKATQKLTTLTSYLQPLSQAASSIYDNLSSLNKDNAFENLGNIGMDLFETYRNINIPQNEQQKAFVYFESLRNTKATFTIQTPFRYYTDMAIETMRVVQSGATRDESRFDITFKKIRYVNTEIKNLDNEVKSENTEDRLAEQTQPTEDEGILSKAFSSTKETVGGWFNNVKDTFTDYTANLSELGNIASQVTSGLGDNIKLAFTSTPKVADIPLDAPNRGKLIDEAIDAGYIAW